METTSSSSRNGVVLAKGMTLMSHWGPLKEHRQQQQQQQMVVVVLGVCWVVL
jgi:hypothetical protein